MTKEQRQQSDDEVAKLMIDRPTDFKFHVAYLAYSETWDKTTSEEERTKLNEITASLSDGKMSYSDFYKKLDELRRPGSRHYAFSRERIGKQRKRDWRKRQAKDMRNARHK
jgi:hypothetical protein